MIVNWRKNVQIEIADFDFNTPEEVLEYMTFWKRVTDSMMKTFADNENSEYDTISPTPTASTAHHHMDHNEPQPSTSYGSFRNESRTPHIDHEPQPSTSYRSF